MAAVNRDPDQRIRYVRRLAKVLTDYDGVGTEGTAIDGQGGVESQPNPEPERNLAATPAGQMESDEHPAASTDPVGRGQDEHHGSNIPFVIRGTGKPASITIGRLPTHARQGNGKSAMVRKAPDVPDGMREVYGSFAQWRKSGTGRMPIPEALWASAAKLAREHGVFQTAKVLGLDYGKLKRLAASPGPAEPTAAPPAAPAPAFVELLEPGGAAVSECLIELEGPRGKMRIQWRGSTAPDLAGLSRTLWEPARIE
jgi:hypothetical protein